jgi:hypothetical protein
VKECTTHHHACDCREEATRKLVNDLIEHARYSCGSITIQRLRAEAVRLGYVQGRSDRPDEKGETK